MNNPGYLGALLPDQYFAWEEFTQARCQPRGENANVKRDDCPLCWRNVPINGDGSFKVHSCAEQADIAGWDE